MTNHTDLKPCPFCSSQAHLIRSQNLYGDGVHWVACQNLLRTHMSPHFPDSEQAITDWNVRTTSPVDTDYKCKKCSGDMKPSKAMGQTFVGGMKDFDSDVSATTFSAGGPGKLIDCIKCVECGWSTTASTIPTPPVKQLEWRRNILGEFRATTITGTYDVGISYYEEIEMWTWMLSMATQDAEGPTDIRCEGEFSSSKAAKAAAQAHHEQTIMEALV